MVFVVVVVLISAGVPTYKNLSIFIFFLQIENLPNLAGLHHCKIIQSGSFYINLMNREE